MLETSSVELKAVYPTRWKHTRCCRELGGGGSLLVLNFEAGVGRIVPIRIQC
jgi:hypothetical protein